LAVRNAIFSAETEIPPGRNGKPASCQFEDGLTNSCHCSHFYEVETEIAVSRFQWGLWSDALDLRR
jgi:hypothetical protein